MEIAKAIFAVFLMVVGIFGFFFSVFILRYYYASKRAREYLRDHSITDGIYVKHGMTIDPKTGLVKSTVSPSVFAIKRFM